MRWFKFLLLALLSFQAQAADQFKLGVGMSLPPYIIQQGDSGMELDIIRASLPKDFEFKLVYLPFARLRVSLSEGAVDGVTPVNQNSGLSSAFLSDSHIQYQNVVITLKSKSLAVKSLADLDGKRVVAFQDAQLYLGSEFALAAKKFANYVETASQDNQVRMLFSERTDAVVMDINIFKYYKNMIKDVDTSKEYVVSELFPVTNYSVAFKTKKHAELFNAGLANLRKTGRYAEIVGRYIK